MLLHRNGTTQCWAKNTQGNLGIGDVHDRGNDDNELGDFLPFTDLGRDAHRLSGGADHTCAILDNKSVKASRRRHRLLFEQLA